MNNKALVFLLGMISTTQAAPEWLAKEFSNTWDVPGKGLEAFLNEECQPSGLDGIQLIAVQNGHGSVFNLHVYCRQDKSATARYRVTMPTAPKGKAFGLVPKYASDPNTRIGPFHFGDEGQPDGFLVVEKIQR